MKINEKALKAASVKLRKLRLTDSVAIKDTPPPSQTVKSIFKSGLGGLYDDDAITYTLRFGVRYYLEAAEQTLAPDGAIRCEKCKYILKPVWSYCPSCGYYRLY